MMLTSIRGADGPARVAHRRCRFKRSDHRFDLRRLDRGADEGRDDLDTLVPLLALDIAYRVVGSFERLDDEVARAHDVRGFGGDTHLVGRLRLSLIDGGAVDEVYQRPQQRV